MIRAEDLFAELAEDPEYAAAAKDLYTASNISLNMLLFRARHRMSQVALARHSGLSRRCIRDLEAMVGNPRLKTLDKLAEALELTTAQLVSRDD